VEFQVMEKYLSARHHTVLTKLLKKGDRKNGERRGRKVKEQGEKRGGGVWKREEKGRSR
jgi:hypothetical protein